jgi:hypothetical protein
MRHSLTKRLAACASVVALVFSQSALAAQFFVGPVFLDSVGAVGATPMGGHLAGNFEIKVRGGFTRPSGVTCDPNYITTKKSQDNFGNEMYYTLVQAVANNRPVAMWVTDDPTLTAWPTRCSLLSADIR